MSVSNLIEKRLRELCEQDKSVERLFAQWQYEKRPVTDALATVVYTFPHYSRHDASHSETI